MSDAVMVALITSVPATLAAGVGVWNAATARQTKEAMVILERNTNSIKDELVKVTGEKAFAEGVKSAHQQENEESRG